MMNRTLFYLAISAAVVLTGCDRTQDPVQTPDEGVLSASANAGGNNQTTNAVGVRRVAVLTRSETVDYTKSSGAFEAMPSTSLTVRTRGRDDLLVITFSARGSVTPSGSAIIPFVFIKCDIDGTPCEPDFNSVVFLYPQFCCDTRSFTWAVRGPAKGTHTIGIRWGMGNPTAAHVSNRTLVVETVGF
jgi:hypothetical protein